MHGQTLSHLQLFFKAYLTVRPFYFRVDSLYINEMNNATLLRCSSLPTRNLGTQLGLTRYNCDNLHEFAHGVFVSRMMGSNNHASELMFGKHMLTLE